MKLVVGLGHPGRKYENTRHNVGFDVVAELVRRTGAEGPRSRFECQLWDAQLAGDRVLFACPQTYMNLSGRAIQPLLAFYKLTPIDLLLICDDLNLPIGKLRLRASGTAGGQKGLQNTIDMLGTNEFARLRIGIDRPPPQMDAADYVLSKLKGADRELLDEAIFKAANGVELWVRDGAGPTMNVVNAEPRPPRKPDTENDDGR